MLDTGYSGWKYDRPVLRDRITAILKTLKRVQDELDPDCLILSGTSGVWLGAALTLAQDLPVILVRKSGENSHGSLVEGPPLAKGQGIILDDFISTGATVNRIIHSLGVWGRGVAAIGVIEHNRTVSSGWGDYFKADNGDNLPVFQMG